MNYPPWPFTADLLEGIRLLAPSPAAGHLCPLHAAYLRLRGCWPRPISFGEWPGGSSGCHHPPPCTQESEPCTPAAGVAHTSCHVLPKVLSPSPAVPCQVPLQAQLPRDMWTCPLLHYEHPCRGYPGFLLAGFPSRDGLGRQEEVALPAAIPNVRERFSSRQASHGKAPQCFPCIVQVHLPEMLN